MSEYQEKLEELSSRRDKEMRYLRMVKRWSLQKIGDRYGVSRQRVHQIIGNTGFQANEYFDTLKDEDWLKETAHLTNDEIALQLNTTIDYVAKHRGGFRHAVRKDENSAVSKGFLWEEWASEKLSEVGIENELMPLRHPFDILAFGNVRIDVKSAETPRSSPSMKNISPTWSFKVNAGNKRDDADIYMLVIAGLDDVFVVPASKIPTKREFLVFAWPTSRPELSKWQKYINRYDLIEKVAKQETKMSASTDEHDTDKIYYCSAGSHYWHWAYTPNNGGEWYPSELGDPYNTEEAETWDAEDQYCGCND